MRILALPLPLVSLVPAVLWGCASEPVRSPAELRRTEAAADESYLSDRFAEARPLYERLAQEDPNPARRDHFRLRTAQCLAALGRTADALAVLDALARAEDPPADPAVAARADAVAGEIHRLAGRDEQARSRLHASLAGGGMGLKKDSVLLSLARVSQRLGRWDEARTHLTSLLADFPISPHRPAATDLLSHHHFSIQVGAFRSASSALSMAESLTRSGVPAFMQLTRADADDLYCVRVGRYQTWPEANGAREELSARGKIARDAFLVP